LERAGQEGVMDRTQFDALVNEFVTLYCSDYFDHAATQIEYDAYGEGMHRAYVSLVTITGKTRRVVLCPNADDSDGICIEAAEDSYLDADTGGLCCVLWLQAEMEAMKAERMAGEQADRCVREANRAEQAEQAERAELEALLWGALMQGALVGEGRIDHCALSIWEELCEYFESRGRLRHLGGRTYEIVAQAGVSA